MDPQPYILVALIVLLVGTAAYAGRRTLRDGLDAIAAFEHAEPVGAVNVPRVAQVMEEAASHGFAPVRRYRCRIGDGWMVVVLGVDPTGIMLEVTCGEDPKSPPPALACLTVLANGRGVLTTQTLGHLPSAEGELRQVLPNGALRDVLDLHRAGLAWLAGGSVEARPSTPQTVLEDYQAAMRGAGSVLRRNRWDVGFRIWWRQAWGRHLDQGPLNAQPGIEERLDRLRALA